VKYSAVILAAGKGVRMCSELPKVAHRVAGRPMILHIVNTVKQAGINDITIIVGYGKEIVQEIFNGDDNIRFAVQEEQLGTGHALMQAEKKVDLESTVLVLTGDTPLLQPSTITKLLDTHRDNQAVATVLTTEISNPYGYGRIIRNPDSSLKRIVEEKDASEEEKKIKEINSGIYCFKADRVFQALSCITTSNAQGEYYLTDVLGILRNSQGKIAILCTDATEEIYGINDRVQLSYAESIIRRRKNIELMKNGITIVDPATTFIDCDVKIGRDTVILPFTMIEGKTTIGECCEIGPGVRISSSFIGSNVTIESSRIREARVGDHCTIGPYSYLRPEAVLHNGVKVGDFVEIKKSTIGEKSKVPHLSYIGDAQVGKEVNIGCGTITCNYDGKTKHPTILEDRVFVGSNTNLVAPVKLGENSIIGAGSTITRDIPANSMGVERAKQRVINNWSLRKRKG